MLIAFLLVCRHLDTSYYDPDNHDGVITHLEPGTLECQGKRPREASLDKAGGGAAAELFQACRRCCESAALSVSAGLEEGSVRSRPGEGLCRRVQMPHSCTHLTR